MFMTILKNSRWFRRRNHLEFFKIFMNIATELSTLSMGHSIGFPISYNSPEQLHLFLRLIFRLGEEFDTLLRPIIVVTGYQQKSGTFRTKRQDHQQNHRGNPRQTEGQRPEAIVAWNGSLKTSICYPRLLIENVYCVPSRVWTVPSLSAWKFWKIRDDFDPDGQLDSIAPEARSNPTARRGRNHLEFFKIFMQPGTELTTPSMGQSIVKSSIWV